MNGIVEQSKALNFIFAGNCLFTIKSLTTDKHYTYKVIGSNTSYYRVYDISGRLVLKVEDNKFVFDKHATFLVDYYKTHNFKESFSDNRYLLILAFCFTIEMLKLHHTHSNIEIWHHGRCGRCARPLTVPESIQLGLGPECAKLLSIN